MILGTQRNEKTQNSTELCNIRNRAFSQRKSKYLFFVGGNMRIFIPWLKHMWQSSNIKLTKFYGNYCKALS